MLLSSRKKHALVSLKSAIEVGVDDDLKRAFEEQGYLVPRGLSEKGVLTPIGMMERS